MDGSASRLSASTRYLDRAAAAVGSHSDSTRALISSAREMVGLVAEAGGQHNLELSDRLMREAVSRARSAYRMAGVAAPEAPEMGRVPHSGMCSYCHYGPDEPWDFDAMPDDFHRSVLTPER